VVGPILGGGVLWEPNCEASLLAGIRKNHADQIPLCERMTDAEFQSHRDWFVRAFVSGECDARHKIEFRAQHLSVYDVLAHVAIKDPAKARRYWDEYLDHFKRIVYSSNRHKGKLKVKVEILKWGKMPRVIVDFGGYYVVLGHSFAIPLERHLKVLNGWKGLKVKDKWIPLANIAAKFHYDVFLALTDDTARDCNTIDRDFLIFIDVLIASGCLVEGSEAHLFLLRVGLSATTVAGNLRSLLVRLFSGTSFTSSMNFVTSYGWLTFFARHLGFVPEEFMCAAEGDDTAIGFCGAAFRRLSPDVSEANVIRLGRMYAKDMKIEKFGWLLPGTAWPCVGGHAVYISGTTWRYVPSVSRAMIKAGYSISYEFTSGRSFIGRIKARADSLNDRFDTIPVFWAYAAVVSAYAATFPGSSDRTAEENFELYEHHWEGQAAGPPDHLDRIAFEIVTGVSPGSQIIIEEQLLDCIKCRDWHRDLTSLFHFWFAAN